MREVCKKWSPYFGYVTAVLVFTIVWIPGIKEYTGLEIPKNTVIAAAFITALLYILGSIIGHDSN